MVCGVRNSASAARDAEPLRYVATMSKQKRKGRIFIDWLRNQRGSTAVTPYSARARPGLPVIVISAQNTIVTAIRATEADAFEYLPKPFDVPKAVELLRRAVYGGNAARKLTLFGDVLMFDYPGYGDTSGTADYAGFHAAGEAVAALARRQADAEGRRPVLVSLSDRRWRIAAAARRAPRNANVEPSPGTDVAPISPPIRSASRREIARPRPEPPASCSPRCWPTSAIRCSVSCCCGAAPWGGW